MIRGRLIRRTKQDTGDLFVADFSTTDQVSLTASQIVLMYAMKEYFEYRMSCACGIPRVELLGTEEDWKRLIEKTRNLASVLNNVDKEEPKARSQTFFVALIPVLEKLLSEFTSISPDKDFWGKIVTEEHYGSGASAMYGWFSKFFWYTKEGEVVTEGRNLSLEDLPCGTVSVPFTFNGNKLLLIAGHFGTKMIGDAIAPAMAWAVIEDTTPE